MAPARRRPNSSPAARIAREHVLALGPRAEQLEARLAGHAVPQRAHPVPGDGEVGHVEELHVGQRRADELRHDRAGGRPLQLVAVKHRRARPAVDRVVVALDRHVPVARRHVVLQPVGDRRVTHHVEQVLLQVEEDRVADEVAVGVDRDVLLGLARAEVRERVDAEAAQQPQRVGAAQEQVGHVMRLVEQHAGGPPRALLGAPVGELGRDGEGVRPRGRLAQQFHRRPGALDRRLEALERHRFLPLSRRRTSRPRNGCRRAGHAGSLDRDKCLGRARLRR